MTNEEVNNQQKKEKKELTKQKLTMCGTNKEGKNKMKKQNNNEESRSIIVGTLKLDLKISSDEAKEIVNNPKGSVARNINKYLKDCIISASKKMLQELNKKLEK